MPVPIATASSCAFARYWRAICRRGIDTQLGVSRAVVEHYRAALSLDRVDVVYNPIDLGAVDGSNRRSEPSARRCISFYRDGWCRRRAIWT